jgi:hypothetical protein
MAGTEDGGLVALAFPVLTNKISKRSALANFILHMTLNKLYELHIRNIDTLTSLS